MKRIGEQLFVAVLVAMSLVWSAASRGESSAQAAALLADIKTQGAAPVVAELWSDNARWNEVMASIGQGQHEWLQVARALRPGTDAGASEALDEAVFLALKTAPSAVLQLLKDGSFETRVVCSSNIGTDYSAAQSKRLIKDRIKALEKVSNPATEAVRTQCLGGLRAALADFDKPRDGKQRNKLRFPGPYQDAETGLNQNYFRDYDPATGRYMESDPVGLSASVNRVQSLLSAGAARFPGRFGAKLEFPCGRQSRAAQEACVESRSLIRQIQVESPSINYLRNVL